MIVFISYSSKNRDLVVQLAAMLSEMGYDVRYDQQHHVGDDWWKKILANIRASSVVLYLLSPEYLDSYPCELEYQYAVACQRVLLPLMIQRIDFRQAPEHVALTQVLDFTDLNNPKPLTRLVGVLRELELKPTLLPSPLPPEPPAPILKLNAVIERITDYSVTLTHDEQKRLLDDIQPFLRKHETRANARYALERFRQRSDTNGPRDLYTDISDHIDSLLETYVIDSSDSFPPPPPPIRFLVIAVIVVLVVAALGTVGWALTHSAPNSTPTQIVQSGTQIGTQLVAVLPTTAMPTQTTIATATPLPPAAITATQAANIAFQMQTADSITAQFHLNQTATAVLWTKTYTPTLTPTVTYTPTITLTPSDTPIPTITKNIQWTPQTKSFNGVSMVLVPPGCFILGNTDGNADERPVGTQCFDKPFWIDEFPVAQLQFKEFGGKATYDPAFIGDRQPVENINWFEARDYCVQRRGGRLPTEVEYEYAARGPDDLAYLWGNTFDANWAVYSGNSDQQSADVGRMLGNVSWVGAVDMAGNVWEWTSSHYQPYPYYPNDGRENDSTREPRTTRGGAWSSSADRIRASSRNAVSPYAWADDVGFRCARDFQL